MRGRDLTGRGRRFEVGQPDRQQHLPAAAAGESAEGLQLCAGLSHSRPTAARGRGVASSRRSVGGDAAEAEHPGTERAQQLTRSPRSAYCEIWPRATASKERPRKPSGTGGPGARRLIDTATGSGGWVAAAARAAEGVGCGRLFAVGSPRLAPASPIGVNHARARYADTDAIESMSLRHRLACRGLPTVSVVRAGRVMTGVNRLCSWSCVVTVAVWLGCHWGWAA